MPLCGISQSQAAQHRARAVLSGCQGCARDLGWKYTCAQLDLVRVASHTALKPDSAQNVFNLAHGGTFGALSCHPRAGERAQVLEGCLGVEHVEGIDKPPTQCTARHLLSHPAAQSDLHNVTYSSVNEPPNRFSQSDLEDDTLHVREDIKATGGAQTLDRLRHNIIHVLEVSFEQRLLQADMELAQVALRNDLICRK
jgi:hypothetical protein